MTQDLDKKFAEFLRRERGTMTYEQFARKTGLTPSSLFRLENGQQSITVRRLGEVLSKMKRSSHDVFGGT